MDILIIYQAKVCFPFFLLASVRKPSKASFWACYDRIMTGINLTTATQALQGNLQQLSLSAAQIARLPSADVDLASESIKQISALRAAEAQMAVIKAEEEGLGILFDAFA